MNVLALTHSIRKGDFVLDVDTEIPATGITGVFGESGSGKTTLLRCIAGLERSTGDDRTPAHKRRIGFVFQEPQLFGHLSVRKNIEFGLRRNPGGRVSVESVVGLLGLADLLERSTTGLSGGEAQRVSIARVLCQSPRLILMDEPLSALDERRRDDVLPYLDRLHAESSVPIIYVSHNIDEICRLSDHLLVFESGKIIAEGGLQEVLTRTDLSPLGGRNAGTAINATQIEYDDEFDLTLFGFSGGELWAPGRYESSSVRLRVAANDVSLSLAAAESSTILNILRVQVEGLQAESAATELVKLRCGDDYFLARITRRSSQRLSLQVGDRVFAQLKSVTVRR